MTKVPKLSEEAWALLGVLYRASSGGPRAPAAGFEKALAELQSHGFARGKAITGKGTEAWLEYFANTDPKFKWAPKGRR